MAMGALIIFWLAMMDLIQSKHFNCEFNGQCTGGTLNCLSGEECTVKCWDTDACTSTTVNCPTNANCDISCDTWHLPACQKIKVNCPTTGNCNMGCAQTSTCLFAEVTWSPDPYLNTLDCGTSNTGCLYDFTVPPTRRPTSVTQTPTTATSNPTAAPSSAPTSAPTLNPTQNPSAAPSDTPTNDPTSDPTFDPTNDPSTDPTSPPTTDPTNDPTNIPTLLPTVDPTTDPTTDPTFIPTFVPTLVPSVNPTKAPTTASPTLRIADPTHAPTKPREQEVIEETVDLSTTSVRATAKTEQGEDQEEESGAKEEGEQLKMVIGVLGGVLFVIVLLGIAFGVYMCARNKAKQTEEHIPIELTNVVPSHVVSVQSDGEAAPGEGAGPGRSVDPAGLPALPHEDAKREGMDDDDTGKRKALMGTGESDDEDDDENDDLFDSGPITKEKPTNKGNVSSDSDCDSLLDHNPDNDKQTKKSSGGHTYQNPPKIGFMTPQHVDDDDNNAPPPPPVPPQ
eukprot:35221_1